MSVKVYTTTKNGKKVRKGYRAIPVYQGVQLGERYFGLKEKTKARLWHDQMITLAKKGYDSNMTLDQAFQNYRDQFTGTSNSKLYVQKSYECFSRDTPQWMGKLVCDFSKGDMNQLFRELDEACEMRLGRKRKHLKREVEILHAVLECYKDDHNNDFQNPVTPKLKQQWAKTPKGTGSGVKVSLSESEAKQLLEMLRQLNDPVYYHICLWQLTSHRQRLGEVLSLEWDDVDWDQEIVWLTGTMIQADATNHTLRNHKQYHTKEGREHVPISFGGENIHLKQSLLALENLKRSRRWVFADERGNVPAYRQVHGVYGKTGFFSEKGIQSHKLRKTAITLAVIACGGDKAKVHGGHSSWGAHERYVIRQQTEIHNPVPAILAKKLGVS